MLAVVNAIWYSGVTKMYHKQRSPTLPVVSRREISNVATSGSVIIGSSSEIFRSCILGNIAPAGIFCKALHINSV
jgi:hypothetical protein